MSENAVPLQPVAHEKVWGTPDTLPWFASSGKKVGEVWLTSESLYLPILVKFIFTSDRLSVQVHPDDAYAGVHESSPGKTEMWHILRADPGARIALGLRQDVSREHLRIAAVSGEIETLLHWIPVRSGDTFFIPAGLIHAIGAGIVLCEIQQPSDITYRLYDYNRPRELHLDKAMEVADVSAYRSQNLPRWDTACNDEIRLVSSPYFITDLLFSPNPFSYVNRSETLQILIALEGEGTLDGKPFQAGMAWALPAGGGVCLFQPATPSRFLRAYHP